MTEQDEEHHKVVEMTGLATTFGLELAVLVVGSAFLADWLERRFGYGTWMTLVTVGAATLMFALHMCYAIQKINAPPM